MQQSRCDEINRKSKVRSNVKKTKFPVLWNEQIIKQLRPVVYSSLIYGSASIIMDSVKSPKLLGLSFGMD
jgi:hypothetical protein